MEKIIKSREILESVRVEISKLEEKLSELSALDFTTNFVPIDLCTGTAMTLQKLSAYEENLFEKIAEFSDAELNTFEEAEKALKDAEAELQKKLLIKKFSGIKTNNHKYDSLIEQLRTSAAADANAPERTIAELLVSDLLNNTTEMSKNELVENSDYYKLAFAFNRNELFYENPDQTPDNSGSPNNSGNSSSDASQPDDSANSANPSNSDSTGGDSSEGEPPPEPENIPDPYSAENHKEEIILDIDLEREEDFPEVISSIVIPIVEESTDTESEEVENDDITEETTEDNESEEDEFDEDNSNNDNIREEESEGKKFEEDSVDEEEHAYDDDDEEIDEFEEDDDPDENEEPSSVEVRIIPSDEVKPIVDEFKDQFSENPNALSMEISQSPEVETKHNVTEIINILSPKGRSARTPVKIFQVIMTELLLYGPKTEDDIYELPDFLKNRISNSEVDGYLEKLYNKGLIARINYDGNILYYFTKKGLKFNNHDRMISNFYCCSDKRMRSNITKRDCRKVYPVTNISVCSSVILSRIVKKYPYYLAIGSSDISVEGLSISVISKPGIRNFALSYVSDEADKLERLYENLNKSLKALNVFEKLNTLIIGSYTRSQAEAVYKIVTMSWKEKLELTKIALYSYTEDKYYYPDTFEEFTDFEDTNPEDNETAPPVIEISAAEAGEEV